MTLVLKILRHEMLTIICSIALILGSAWEVGDTLFEDLLSAEFSTGHGVLLFGIVHGLRASQELVAKDRSPSPE